jgi:hypothetical protein
MKTYTVILLYPDYLTGDYGEDIFVEAVKAKTPEAAVSIVQHNAGKANPSVDEVFDIKMILVLAGDCEVLGDATGIYETERA